MRRPHFCIIIPTYNEAENIRPMVEYISRIFPKADILVVDDHSPDNTAAIVKRLQKKYHNLFLLKRPHKEGLGAAYIAAFKHISHLTSHISHVIMMDADFSHNPTYLPLFKEGIKHYDLMIGSRYTEYGGAQEWEFWRRWISMCGNCYVSALLKNFQIRDWTGGFNCINVKFLKRVNFDTISASGYAFQIELKYLLAKLGARVREIPIIFEPRRGGESKLTNHIIWEGIVIPWKITKRK